MARKSIKRPRLNSRKRRRNHYLEEEEEKRKALHLFYEGVVAEMNEGLARIEARKEVNRLDEEAVLKTVAGEEPV